MADPNVYVWFDDKRIIPAPMLSFNKAYKRTDSGEIIGTDLTVTLSGTLVACKGFDFSSGVELYTGTGYPADDTSCCKFDNLLNMQEKMREHFAPGQDFKVFKVQQVGESAKEWYARTVSIDFAESNDKWVDTVPFTIVLELQSNETATIGDVANWPEDNIVSFTETWNIDFKEEDGEVYLLSHELSCQAKDYYDSSTSSKVKGWKKAKEWMTNRLAGSDYTGSTPNEIKNYLIFGSTGFNLSSYDAYNYEVNKLIDEFNGIFTIRETWELAKDPVFRRVNVDVNLNPFDEDSVTVDGSYISLLDTTGSNPNDARDAFDSWISSNGHYTIANTYYSLAGGSGTLNSNPLSSSVRYVHEKRGSTDLSTRRTREVGFTYQFSTKDFCNTDAYKEDININIQNQADVFAIVPILGRTAGPIIQDKETKTAKKYKIDINWQYPKNNNCDMSMPTNVDVAVQSVVTSVGVCPGASGTYLESDNEFWNPRKGTYRRSLTYVCSEC